MRRYSEKLPDLEMYPPTKAYLYFFSLALNKGNFLVSHNHPVLELLIFLLIIHTVIYVNFLLFSISNYINESIGNIYEVTAPL